MRRNTGLRTGHRYTRWRKGRRATRLPVALLALAPLATAQQDHQAGEQAYLKGDPAEAARIWRPLADAGDRLAQFSLGSLYIEGAGVEKAPEESAKWFRLAACQGHAPAQFHLGNAYKQGKGVPQDDFQAVEWWRKAAEQGLAPAQYNLATQHFLGLGVQKDEQAAIRWYWRAAENGHAQAQRLFSVTDPSADEVRESAPQAIAVSDEAWLLAQNPDDYTLQLLATHSEDRLRAYLGKHRVTERMVCFGFLRDGEQWFAAVHGAYPSKARARSSIATLPPELGERPPWIRSFGGIQELVSSSP